MKRTVLSIVLLLMYTAASAQLFSKEKITNQENFDKDFLTWGYFLGFNSYDFKFKYDADQAIRPDILVETTVGFNVGLVGDMRINEYLNLRFEPGLYITRRNLEYSNKNNIFTQHPYFISNEFRPGDLFREVKSTYLHFPLLLKVSTKRINNFKPFLVGGFSTALNLSSNEDNPEDNRSTQFRTKSSMLFYELGFGIDFYLEWFKFTPSIRGVFAINDELVRDNGPDETPWTGTINKMQTRGVFVNFTFQ
ncbi:porin family protein [Gelidibacter salicanalis]|uniref:PorT family protein n=1 Tax=Gelidibacter salicanalis TaxID=291193 RepID=A0A934KPK8_9FLAO|nr:porin family protein [Gelidibacter salicanalis]MBJ7879131.1 PorT family protein [Gelidibacter salicanalis]